MRRHAGIVTYLDGASHWRLGLRVSCFINGDQWHWCRAGLGYQCVTVAIIDVLRRPSRRHFINKCRRLTAHRHDLHEFDLFTSDWRPSRPSQPVVGRVTARHRLTVTPRRSASAAAASRQTAARVCKTDTQVLVECGVQERVEHAVGIAQHRHDVRHRQDRPRRP